jgi:hypothetical protein
MNEQQITATAKGLRKSNDGKHPEQFPSEDKLQEYCYKWWNEHFRGISVLHSVPNGVDIPAAVRMKLIGTGLLGGAADLELKFKPARIAHIEMKNGPKEIDPKQKVFKARIEALGHDYYKATDFFEFVVVICFCLNVQPSTYI